MSRSERLLRRPGTEWSSARSWLGVKPACVVRNDRHSVARGQLRRLLLKPTGVILEPEFDKPVDCMQPVLNDWNSLCFSHRKGSFDSTGPQRKWAGRTLPLQRSDLAQAHGTKRLPHLAGCGVFSEAAHDPW